MSMCRSLNASSAVDLSRIYNTHEDDSVVLQSRGGSNDGQLQLTYDWRDLQVSRRT
jgi:hypothetical protein